MSATARDESLGPDEAHGRCGACGAPRGEAAPVPSTAAPTPSQEHAAPAGTHCEWCGAEFPDED